jgi:hypothetical protein
VYKDIDIAHDRAGRANISVPYTSDANPRFILHDSKGFEPGTASNWDVVESFLRGRSATAELKDRVHAIWCRFPTLRYMSSLTHLLFTEKVMYRDPPDWIKATTDG